MNFTQMVAGAFSGATAKLKRNTILYAVCAASGLTAVIFASSASLLALEPLVGAVYARLILAGVFAAIMLGIVLTLRLGGPAPAARAGLQVNLHAEAQAAKTSAQFSQLAMIIEAVLLGYSMSRRR